GVVVNGDGTNGVSNKILSNSIFGNVRGSTRERPGLGIRLTNGGNHDQPAPAILKVDAGGITATVIGPPNTTVEVQFFSNDPRPDNNIQGQTRLDPSTAHLVALPDSGRLEATFTVPGATP